MVWRKLKIWLLRGRYIMSYSLLTLFFSLNPSCCSLHSFCSTKCLLQTGLARSGCSHIQCGIVSHPSSDSPRATCLLVNAEILYFLEDTWSWVVVVLSWLHTVFVSTCSMSFLPRGHSLWQSVTPCLLESWTRSSQKVIFLKNHWVFLQAIF